MQEEFKYSNHSPQNSLDRDNDPRTWDYDDQMQLGLANPEKYIKFFPLVSPYDDDVEYPKDHIGASFEEFDDDEDDDEDDADNEVDKELEEGDDDDNEEEEDDDDEEEDDDDDEEDEQENDEEDEEEEYEEDKEEEDEEDK